MHDHRGVKDEPIETAAVRRIEEYCSDRGALRSAARPAGLAQWANSRASSAASRTSAFDQRPARRVGRREVPHTAILTLINAAAVPKRGTTSVLAWRLAD